MTADEQRRINQALQAVRAVENGCPGVSVLFPAAVAFRELLELWEAKVDPHSRPLQVVQLTAVADE